MGNIGPEIRTKLLSNADLWVFPRFDLNHQHHQIRANVVDGWLRNAGFNSRGGSNRVSGSQLDVPLLDVMAENPGGAPDDLEILVPNRWSLCVVIVLKGATGEFVTLVVPLVAGEVVEQFVERVAPVTCAAMTLTSWDD